MVALLVLCIRLMHRDKILEIRKQSDFHIPKDFGRILDCAKGSRQTNKRPDPKTVHKVLALKRMDKRKNTRSRKAGRLKSKDQCRELYQDAIERSYFIAKLDVSENDIHRLQEVFATVQKTFGILRLQAVHIDHQRTFWVHWIDKRL